MKRTAVKKKKKKKKVTEQQEATAHSIISSTGEIFSDVVENLGERCVYFFHRKISYATPG